MSSGPEPLRPEAFRDLLQENLAAFGLVLDDAKTSRLARFLSELDRWRRSTNLTGRLSADELVSHALESAFGSHLLPALGTGVDIGTGGGFPGVPLAVCRPDLRWVWVEPRERRTAFLRHVARTIPVENAEVVSGRVEDLSRGAFDFVTSRGLKLDGATLDHLLKPDGFLLLWTTREDWAKTPLSGGFRLEQAEPIPMTRRRVVAVFRKS
ncbi:MAG: hypothetical protein DMF54_01125 [Acidobacteria bacterium]|nr:MAG: hypothetical protein DMF54_01125 [Acidobacteriota bacterium]